ncbi:response regulator [Marinobacter hydrocarbonoclasticus]|nr:response regulator [Marinobacter nauticus]
MSVDWEARWQRERQARLEAESVLEARSEELYEANRQLDTLNRQQGLDLQDKQRLLERRRQYDGLIKQAGLILLQGEIATPVTTLKQLHSLLEQAGLPLILRWHGRTIPDKAKDYPWAESRRKGALSGDDPLLAATGARHGHRLSGEKHPFDLLFLAPEGRHWSEIEQGVFETLRVMCEAFFHNVEAYRRLKQAERDTQAMAKVRSRFLAMVTHELRTPLNGLLAGAELLSETDLQQAQSELLAIVQDSGENLLALVNDVLDFSKIDDRGFTLHPESVELKALTEATLGLVKQLADEKGLVATLHWHGPSACWVWADALRLRQILLNLLSNAIKFTDKGAITLTVTVAGSDPCNVRVLVSDTGQGISKDKLSKLFEPFYQTSGEQRGTGLGLAICYRLCASMGATLRVDSQEGQGSRFEFDLALPPAEPVFLPVSGKGGPQQSGHILLVEDTRANQVVACLMLRQAGYQVTLAEHGQAALKQYEAGRFDLILMDCRMPVMDGFDCTVALREQGAREPIIALTATTTEEELAHCLRCGMNDVMTKPIRKESLLGKIQQWLSGSESPVSLG